MKPCSNFQEKYWVRSQISENYPEIQKCLFVYRRDDSRQTSKASQGWSEEKKEMISTMKYPPFLWLRKGTSLRTGAEYGLWWSNREGSWKRPFGRRCLIITQIAVGGISALRDSEFYYWARPAKKSCFQWARWENALMSEKEVSCHRCHTVAVLFGNLCLRI